MTGSRFRALGAVGSAIAFALATPIAAPAASAAKTAAAGAIGPSLTAVACPSVDQCTAVDPDGEQLTFNPTSPGATPARRIEATFNPANRVASVSCPSTTQCTAVDDHGNEMTFDPQISGRATLLRVDPDTGVRSVACPTVTQCTVSGSGAYAVTFNPNGTSSEPSFSTLTSGKPELFDLACPTSGQCIAVGATHSGGQEQFVTFNPNQPGIEQATPIPVAAALSGVDCPSPQECAAVDHSGRELTFNPSAPSNLTPTSVDGAAGPGNALASVACPSPTQCTAVNQSGEQVTFDPTKPGTHSVMKIDGDKHLTDVACPSVTQCTAVDDGGRSVTFNPTASSAPSPVLIDRHPSTRNIAALRKAIGKCDRLGKAKRTQCIVVARKRFDK